MGPGAIDNPLVIQGHNSTGHHRWAGLARGSRLTSTPYISSPLPKPRTSPGHLAANRQATSTSTVSLLDKPAVPPTDCHTGDSNGD